MATSKSVAKIKKQGEVSFEIFNVSAVVSARQRVSFRVNKSEYFRQLFERASYKVNSVTVTASVDRELNTLLDKTTGDEPVSVDVYVYHCINAGSSNIWRVSDYLVLEYPMLPQ